ncbi:hypothetical protein BSL78_18500 [Apostichopus japonicus]|uniref:Uncharacterized protein n=1 Tax=Stichopus japonicus TaxID=307972 RepID=A0A2G8K9F7_STIJA|nr:hypothetical protein BSL78_18500 [Apostichopus japonicus]
MKFLDLSLAFAIGITFGSVFWVREKESHEHFLERSPTRDFSQLKGGAHKRGRPACTEYAKISAAISSVRKKVTVTSSPSKAFWESVVMELGWSTKNLKRSVKVLRSIWCNNRGNIRLLVKSGEGATRTKPREKRKRKPKLSCTVNFNGNMKHSMYDIHARPIRGLDRRLAGKTLSMGVKPMKVLLRNLSSKSSEVIASGNRNDCGRTLSVMQKISSESRSKERDDEDEIKSLLKKQQKYCLKYNHRGRVPGFINKYLLVRCI